MASSQRFTCLCGHVLSNLRKVGRIKAVYDRRIVPIRVKHGQSLLYSTMINDERLNNIPQVPRSLPEVQSNSPRVQKTASLTHWKRESWPTSSCWKKFDFQESGTDEVFESFVKMNESDIPQCSPRKFYYQMSLKDPTVPWTEEEAVAVLELLSTSRLGLTNQMRLSWIGYMVQQMKSQGPLPVSVYNAYLKCYLNLNHTFDPVKVLSEMMEAGVGPNKQTFALLLKRYAFMKDIDAARNVYKYVEADESLRSEESTVNMILGHMLVGNEPEIVMLVQTLSGTCSDAKLKKVLYPTLLLGNALVGNESRLDKLGIEIDESKLLSAQSILDILEVCSYQGARSGVEFIVKFFSRRYGYFNSGIGPSLTSLMCNGHHDLAYKLFSESKTASGIRFYNAACRAEMAPELVYHYMKKMVENGCWESSFDQYLECLLRHNGCPDLRRKVLPVLKENDMEIRPVYLWEIINDIKENGKLEDLREILPYYTIDMDTEEFFLFPCLKKFKAKPDEWLKLCQESGDFDKDELKYLLLGYALYINDIELVKKVLEKGLPLLKILGRSDTNRLCRSIAWHLKDSKIFQQFVMSLGLKQEDFNSEPVSLVAEYQRLIMADHVPKYQVVKLAARLLQKARFRDAKSLLFIAKFEENESGSGLFKCKLFDIPVTDQNKDFAKKLIRQMIGRGYFNLWTKSSEQRMHGLQFSTVVIQNYLKFIISSGDDKELIQFLNEHRKRYELETITVYSALQMLDEQSRKDSIHKVLNHLKHASWPSDRIGLCIAIGLIENKKMNKAEKALQQCIFREETCTRIFTYLLAEEKFEVMEKLYNLITEKFSLKEDVKKRLQNLMKGQGLGENKYLMKGQGLENFGAATDEKPTGEAQTGDDNKNVTNSVENPENTNDDSKKMENSVEHSERT